MALLHAGKLRFSQRIYPDGQIYIVLVAPLGLLKSNNEDNLFTLPIPIRPVLFKVQQFKFFAYNNGESKLLIVHCPF